MKVLILLIFSVFPFLKSIGMEQIDVPAQNRSFLVGQWGWDLEQCQSNPATVSFNSDGSILFWDTPKGMFLGDDSKPLNRIEYVINSQKFGVLSTSIEDEDRLDDNGNAVKWDLVLQTESSFCWRRADWDVNSCTKSMIKCK